MKTRVMNPIPEGNTLIDCLQTIRELNSIIYDAQQVHDLAGFKQLTEPMSYKHFELRYYSNSASVYDNSGTKILTIY